MSHSQHTDLLSRLLTCCDSAGPSTENNNSEASSAITETFAASSLSYKPVGSFDVVIFHYFLLGCDQKHIKKPSTSQHHNPR